MMLRRVLTAAVGIAVVVFVIKGFGEEAFFVFVLLVVALALREFFSMALPDEDVWGKRLGIILGCFVLFSVFLDSRLSAGNSSYPCFLSTGCCVFSFFALFFYHISFSYKITDAFNQIAIKFFGIFYIALLFSYVILLRACSDGTNLLFFLLFVTWAGDTGAYVVGSWKGKNALCRKISPKKTIEGALGSIVSGVLISFLCRMFFLEKMSILNCLVLGVGINLMNQFGDLSESVIKRAFGVKDSGSILPGHGGVLDRIDSLLFAAPFLFYYVKIVKP